MKFVIVLSTLIAAIFSYPIVKTWTLNELSTAIEKQSDPAMQPYLVDALNQIMYALFTGSNENVHGIIPSPTGDKTWTMEQLKKAIEDPDTNPTYQPFILRALHQLNNMNADGIHQNSVEVDVPALDISVWTISDVEEAKDDPRTKPALIPYLKKAEDKIKETLNDGEKKESVKVTLVTPVGLVPVESGAVLDIIPRSTVL